MKIHTHIYQNALWYTIALVQMQPQIFSFLKYQVCISKLHHIYTRRDTTSELGKMVEFASTSINWDISMYM